MPSAVQAASACCEFVIPQPTNQQRGLIKKKKTNKEDTRKERIFFYLGEVFHVEGEPARR
jgi:hypothetical protein